MKFLFNKIEGSSRLLQTRIEAGEEAFDDEVDLQVWRAIAELRRRRVYTPWLIYLRAVGSAASATWRVLHGKYRRATTKIHGGSNPASSAGAGAGSLSPAGQSHSGGLTIGTTAGAITGVTISVGSVHASSDPVPIPEIVDMGIKAGEVTAYRCWDLRDDGFLCSCVQPNCVWFPGEPMEGDPFDSRARAGVYAFKSVLDLHEYGKRGPKSITGMVDMWGEIVEHEHGYRAQYAAVSWIDDSPYYDAKALRKKYGIRERRKARNKK